VSITKTKPKKYPNIIYTHVHLIANANPIFTELTHNKAAYTKSSHSLLNLMHQSFSQSVCDGYFVCTIDSPNNTAAEIN